MPFVNERIPVKDVESFGLKEIDEIFRGTRARDWTIDRERDIYLRNIRNGREEFVHQTIWTFYWKGSQLAIRLDLLDAGGARGEPGWSHWRLVNVNGSFGLPPPLKVHQAEIIADLQEALHAYKDGGIFAANTTYQVNLDFDPGLIL